MNRISEHISYNEAVHSQTASRKGIDNTPDDEQLLAMMLTAECIYEPIRAAHGPIYISSFFRSKKLNKAVGGSSTSQHVKGEAIDLDCDVWGRLTNMELAAWVRDNLEFDQMIKEGVGADGTGGWIHISYRAGRNRKQILNISF